MSQRRRPCDSCPQKIALEVKETGTPSDYAQLQKTCETLGNYVDLPGFIPSSMV